MNFKKGDFLIIPEKYRKILQDVGVDSCFINVKLKMIKDDDDHEDGIGGNCGCIEIKIADKNSDEYGEEDYACYKSL